LKISQLIYGVKKALTFGFDTMNDESVIRKDFSYFIKSTYFPYVSIYGSNRSITADTALRFDKFWLGLQDDFDLENEKNQKEKEIDGIKPIQGNAA